MAMIRLCEGPQGGEKGKKGTGGINKETPCSLLKRLIVALTPFATDRHKAEEFASLWGGERHPGAPSPCPWNRCSLLAAFQAFYEG